MARVSIDPESGLHTRDLTPFKVTRQVSKARRCDPPEIGTLDWYIELVQIGILDWYIGLVQIGI